MFFGDAIKDNLAAVGIGAIPLAIDVGNRNPLLDVFAGVLGDKVIQWTHAQAREKNKLTNNCAKDAENQTVKRMTKSLRK